MNKFKKFLTTLVATLTLGANVVGLASCGGGTDFTKDVDIVAYDGSEITVTFYHTMGATLKGVLDKHITEFNKIYPNIKIEHETQGDYPELRNTIGTMVSSGHSPSIAYCYPDHVALYNMSKAVVTLDGYINSDEMALTGVTAEDGTAIQAPMGMTAEEKADFIEGYYNEGLAYGDNKMYTLPFSKSTEVMYYNKTVFAENGWEVPTTWDEMEALCAEIKAKFPKDIPLGYDSEANWFITMTEQLGTPYTSPNGEKYLFNTEENRAFVERFRGWYEQGYVTTEEIYGAYTSALFTEIDPEKQKIYMCIGSSAGASYQTPKLVTKPVVDENGDPVVDEDGFPVEESVYPFEVGITQIPQVNPESPKVIQQGPSICIFKKTNPQEVAASWLVAKYFTTNVAFQTEFSMANGYTPVIKSAQADPTYAAFLNKAETLEGAARNQVLQASSVKQTLAQMDAYYVSPAFNGSSAARDQVGLLMQNCFTNKTSGNQTAADLIAKQFKTTIDYLVYEY